MRHVLQTLIGQSLFAGYGLARRFRRDPNGVAAVEFALIFPVLLALYLGVVDASQILTASRKASHVSSAVGDLVAQAISIDDDGIDNIFAAAEAMLEPFPTDALTVVVTSVIADADGNTTVDWSDGLHASARAEGSTIVLPEGLVEPGTSVIMSEVTYEYSSAVSELVAGGSVDLDDTFYLRPRKSLMVARP